MDSSDQNQPLKPNYQKNLENILTSQLDEKIGEQNFHSIDSQQAGASNKIFNRYQQHLKSPLPSNFNLGQKGFGMQQRQSNVGLTPKPQGSSVFNAQSSVMSVNSIQTMTNKNDGQSTYVPFLKQTPISKRKDSTSLMNVKFMDGANQLRSIPYPSSTSQKKALTKSVNDDSFGYNDNASQNSNQNGSKERLR